ncbi:hypothetical protein Emag_004889 [Eimeria magna]
MASSEEKVGLGGPRWALPHARLAVTCLTVCALLFWGTFSEAILRPFGSGSAAPQSILPPRIPVGVLGTGGPLGGPLLSHGAPSNVVKSLRGGGIFGGAAPDPKKDIEGKDTLKRAPHLLTLAGPHDADVAAVFVHPKRARLLQLQPGQPVVLRGRRRRKTAGVLIEDSSLGEADVSVHPRVFKHLKLVEGDLLLIEKLQNLVPAARVYVQVFKDSLPLPGIVGPPSGSGGPLVGPEVERAVDFFFRQRARPVRVGDQFRVSLAPAAYDRHPAAAAAAAAKPQIEVKVMRLQGDDGEEIEFGIVSDGAEVLTGREPIDSETYDSGSEVTYDDLGGLRKEVKLLREFVELPLRFPDVFKQVRVDPYLLPHRLILSARCILCAQSLVALPVSLCLQIFAFCRCVSSSA